MISIFHTCVGFLSLISGCLNFFVQKGSPLHRRLGWIYVISMYVLIVSSFFIYSLFNTFGVFHIMSIVSGVGLTIAVYFIRFKHRHPNWLVHHYFWISYSYVGLIMATCSHLFDYLPNWSYTNKMMLFWILPFIGGSILIYGPGKKTLSKTIQRYHRDIE